MPLVPAVLVASTAGLLFARSFFGTSIGGPDDTKNPVPVPRERLVVLDVGIIVAGVAITSLSLLFLRRSTRVSELRAAA